MAWLVFFILISFHQVHKYQFQKLENQLQDRNGPSKFCEKDWYPFGDKCYKVGGKKLISRVKWEEAKERCSEDGATLVTIHSQELQDFLAVVLQLEVKENLWIGLHDKINESSYEWLDGSGVDYTFWEPNEPSGSNRPEEDCVEMVYMSKGKTGAWNDIDCNRVYGFICEKDKVQLLRKPPNPMFCSEDEKGWKFGNSCYYYVSEREEWSEAEKYCQNTHQGHLVTIKDFVIVEFLDYIFRKSKEEYWIGIQIKEEWQQQWSSGWYVAESHWEKNEVFEHGTCMLRIKRKEWLAVPCTEKYSFVCERSSINPPVLKLSVENSSCPTEPNDWRDLGGDYCYHFSTEHLTWFEAQFRCMIRGGTLASVHSQLESDVLQPFVQSMKASVFIGLYRQSSIDEEFKWTDGSPMDFKAWDSGEPNGVEEFCGEMRPNMKWNDLKCSNKWAFICSVKKLAPNITSESVEETNLDGFPLAAIIVVVLFIFFVGMLFGIVACFIRRKIRKRVRRASTTNLEAQIRERQEYRKSERAEDCYVDAAT